MNQLEGSKKELANTKQELVTIRTENEELKVSMDTHHKSLQDALTQLADLSKELDSFKQQTELERKKTDQTISVLNESLIGKDKEIERQSSTIKKMESELGSATKEREDHEALLTAQWDQLASISSVFSQLTGVPAPEMPAPAPDLKGRPKDSNTTTWSVKFDTETLSSIDMETLVSWVADCRLAADHQVSQDGQNWVAAETLEELDMKWVLDLGDGNTFGPLAPSAIKSYMADGALDGNTPLKHKDSGETRTAADITD